MTVSQSHNMAHGRPTSGARRAPGSRSRRALWLTPTLALLVSGCPGLLARQKPTVSPATGSVTRPATRTRGTPPDTPPASRVVPPAPPPEAEPVTPEPDASPSDSAGVARLVGLAHVWHVAALHHPWIATRGVPWDSALIIATTRVRSANTSDALLDGYRRLLRLLQDPLARIEPREVAPRAAVPVLTEQLGDSVLLIRLSPDAALDTADSALVAQAIYRSPPRVLLDLRGDPTSDAYERAKRLDVFLQRSGFVDAMVHGAINAPVIRTREIGVVPSRHDRETTRDAAAGLDDQDAWRTSDANIYRGTAATPRRVVALADSGSLLPGVLLAMHDAAQMSLVADGVVSDASTVPQVRVPIDSTSVAIIRTGELLHLDGTLGVIPDTVVTRDGTADAARQAALALVQGTMRLPLAERPLPTFVARASTPVFYDTTAYPFMGARLLGGFRLWSAMRARHALRDAFDDDLDAVFERVIPKLEAARGRIDYARAIADLATSLDDVAATPTGASYELAIGEASMPFRLRAAEGRVFMTDVIGDSITTRLGLTRGTEVIAVDGYPVGAWLAERRRLAPASNDWTRLRASLAHLTRGGDANMIVKVKDATTRERTIDIPRRVEYRAALPTIERPDAAPVRFLDDGILYIDVERLDATTMTSALGRLGAAGAVVLDLRGTLHVDDTPLLARFATEPATPLAQLVQRVSTEPCLASIRQAALTCTDVRASHLITRRIDTSSVFTGHLVALIDERTSGAMERFALALESMSRVKFVGSSSAGSLSVPTPLSLPGGLHVGIVTQEMRRADGGQLQRVGLTPSIDARPTARGLRTGDDDVLIRAQQWVQQQFAPQRRRR